MSEGRDGSYCALLDEAATEGGGYIGGLLWNSIKPRLSLLVPLLLNGGMRQSGRASIDTVALPSKALAVMTDGPPVIPGANAVAAAAGRRE